MLKGEAKKTYQREYMRGYMKRLRLKQRLLRPSTSKPEEAKPIRVCEACGESRVVEGHHIDRSHDNQSAENLIDLCPTCHKVLHKQGLTVEELLYKTPNYVSVIAAPFGVMPRPQVDADGNAIYEEG